MVLMHRLHDYKVAILITDGFEYDEMTKPKKALEQEGAKTFIVSPNPLKVKGWKHKSWKGTFDVDKQVKKARAKDFDALLLPGGVLNPDTLRMDPQAVRFVKEFIKRKRPIAAICHGPSTLIDAGGVKGKKMTSWPSIKMDLIHAGAKWVNKNAVKDENLVTSRQPDDIPAFNRAMIELFTSRKKKK
jgi:protease I